MNYYGGKSGGEEDRMAWECEERRVDEGVYCMCMQLWMAGRWMVMHNEGEGLVAFVAQKQTARLHSQFLIHVMWNNKRKVCRWPNRKLYVTMTLLLLCNEFLLLPKKKNKESTPWVNYYSTTTNMACRAIKIDLIQLISSS